MAWNDNNNQTPPELDEVIKDFQNRIIKSNDINTFNSKSLTLKTIEILEKIDSSLPQN